jgi:hypothetical protein
MDGIKLLTLDVGQWFKLISTSDAEAHAGYIVITNNLETVVKLYWPDNSSGLRHITKNNSSTMDFELMSEEETIQFKLSQF